MSFKIHLLHYLILILILASGLGLFMRFQHFPRYQFFAILATVVGYVSWGVVHHKVEKRLSIGVVMEYVLVGGLVLLLFSLTLLR